MMMSVPRGELIADGLIGHMVVGTSEIPCSDDCSVLDVSRADIWRHIVEFIVRERPDTTELRWEATDVSDRLL